MAIIATPMTIPQKLQVIQKTLGLTQTKLAQKLGVSFAAFNSWWTGKSQPRPKMRASIDELFLEVTGQKIIPADQLTAKKQALQQKSKEYRGKHKSIIAEILDNPDIRDQFILKLTYHSNRIEGSTLTEPDTAAILFDNIALPNKSIIEQLEAKNHQTALNYLFDRVAKKEKIDEALVFKLHGILMNGIKPDAGAYRNHGVRITGVNLPTANYASVPRLMGEVMARVAKKMPIDNTDIIALCAAVHSKFEQIHPFSDGNGRTGRLLMDAMLLQKNLPPAIIRQQQKRLYYTYLYKAQTKEDQSQLEDFLCDAIVDGFRILERRDVA
jgi:Fic family protein/DNA-binding XRE family transcriptional regulator